MQRRNVLISLLLSAAPIAGAQQRSATSPEQYVVGRTPILIPPPTGFVETSRRAPELWRAASLVPQAGGVLVVAHFVPDADIKALESGKTVTARQYMLVQLPRAAEHAIATEAQFNTLRSGTTAMQRNLAAQLEPQLAAALAKISGGQSAGQTPEVRLSVGEMVPVSIDRDESNLLVYTLLAKVSRTESGATVHIPTVSTLAYCFTKGKIFMLAGYREFNSPRDIQASRNAIMSWARATLNVN